MIERPTHRGEGEVVPRDVAPGEELDLEAFGAGGELRAREMRAIDQLHLADARNVIDRQQAVDDDPRIGLFPGFADRAGERRLVKLEKSRGQGPIAAPRIDGAP